MRNYLLDECESFWITLLNVNLHKNSSGRKKHENVIAFDGIWDEFGLFMLIGIKNLREKNVLKVIHHGPWSMEVEKILVAENSL